MKKPHEINTNPVEIEQDDGSENVIVPEEYAPKGRTENLIWEKYRQIPTIEREIADIPVERRVGLVGRLVQELLDLAFMNPRELFDDDGTLRPVTDIPDHVFIAIQSLDVSVRKSMRKDEGNEVETVKKIKFADKSKYLYLLGKVLKLWDGDGTIPIDEAERKYREEQRKVADEAIQKLVQRSRRGDEE